MKKLRKPRRQGRDPNMDYALKWAEEICPLKDLVRDGGIPSLLLEPEDAARIVHVVDTPLVNQSLLTKISRKEKLYRESKIAEIACALVPMLPFAPFKLVSCVMRMWSGCLGCAKTVAFETRSGPNTPEQRQKVFREKIDVLATKDPYYLMGVMAGPYLRKIRGQGYSLDGVPEEYIQKYKLRID